MLYVKINIKTENEYDIMKVIVTDQKKIVKWGDYEKKK